MELDLSSVIAQRTLGPTGAMACAAAATQEEATESLACAAGIGLGVPTRAPDTLMRQTPVSCKVPEHQRSRVRALAGPL